MGRGRHLMAQTVVSGTIDIVSRYDQGKYLRRQNCPRIVTMISASNWDYDRW